MFIVITFWPILVAFKGFGKIKKTKMVDPRGPPFGNHDVIATSYDVIRLCCGTRWNILGRTIYPGSFVVLNSYNALGVKKGGQFVPVPVPARRNSKKAQAD